MALSELTEGRYYSYDALVESMGLDEVVAWEEDWDYQGDTFALLRQGEEYGLLNFGWGSCSGCDALEAAYGNIQELTELRDEFYKSIRWFPSMDAFLEWAQHRDGAELQWFHTSALFKRLLDGVLAVKSVKEVL